MNFHPEAEAERPPACSISTRSRPTPTNPTTRRNRLKYLPRRPRRRNAQPRRLSILAKEGGRSVHQRAGQRGRRGSYDFYRESSIEMTCKPRRSGRWPSRPPTEELRRALQYGFQPAELKEAVAPTVPQRARSRPPRRPAPADPATSPGKSSAALAENNVFTTPADDLALFEPALDQGDRRKNATAALRTAWAVPHRYVMVAGNTTIPGDPVAAITAAPTSGGARRAPSRRLEKIVRYRRPWAYTNFGAPGEIAKREHVEDLDITCVTFANGVRLNLKKTRLRGQLLHPRQRPRRHRPAHRAGRQ